MRLSLILLLGLAACSRTTTPATPPGPAVPPAPAPAAVPSPPPSPQPQPPQPTSTDILTIKGQLDRIDADLEAAYAARRGKPDDPNLVRDAKLLDWYAIGHGEPVDILAFARKAEQESALSYAAVAANPAAVAGRPWVSTGKLVDVHVSEPGEPPLTLGIFRTGKASGEEFAIAMRFAPQDGSLRPGLPVDVVGLAIVKTGSIAKLKKAYAH